MQSQHDNQYVIYSITDGNYLNIINSTFSVEINSLLLINELLKVSVNLIELNKAQNRNENDAKAQSLAQTQNQAENQNQTQSQIQLKAQDKVQGRALGNINAESEITKNHQDSV